MAKKRKSTNKVEQEEKKPIDKAELVQACSEAVTEFENLRKVREKINKKNWDIHYGRYKFKKRKGQSRMFLHKTALVAEQLAASFSEVLEKIDVEAIGGFEDAIFQPELVRGILKLYLEKAKFELVGMDAIKIMLQEGSTTTRVGGQIKTDVMGNKYWCLTLINRPFEDVYYDLHGKDDYGYGLYLIDKKMMDKHELLKLANMPNSGYDKEAIERLDAATDPDEAEKNRKAGNVPGTHEKKRRVQIKLEEYWGSPLSEDGDLMEDENGKPMENVVFTVANGREIIRGPIKNPKWHNKPPYVTGYMIRCPGSDFPKAPLDNASDLSIAQSELFNLMMDGGMASVFGVRQVRPDMLRDPRQIADGIPAQASLTLKQDAPMGEKAVEQLYTGQAPNEILAFYNIIDGLISEMSLLNEAAMGGMAPRKPLATELVQAGQAVAKVLELVAKTIALTYIEPLAELSWAEILQNVDTFPEDDLVRVVSLDTKDVDRAKKLVAGLNSLTKTERFDRGLRGFKFKGISNLKQIRKVRDLQKYQTYAQMAFSTPQMQQAFEKENSITRFLAVTGDILGIDRDLFKKTEEEIKFEQEIAKIRENALIQNEMAGNQNSGPSGAQSAQGSGEDMNVAAQPGSGQGEPA